VEDDHYDDALQDESLDFFNDDQDPEPDDLDEGDYGSDERERLINQKY